MDEQTQPNPDNYSDTTEMEPELIDHVSKILSVGVKPIYKVELARSWIWILTRGPPFH